MSHKLARYAVSVTLSGEPQLLGDFDGEGADARDFLARGLAGVSEASEDGTRELATAEGPDVDGEIVDVLLQTGEAGVRSRIRKPEETVERNPEDAEELMAFALFRIPPGGQRGDAVIHQPHGRGIRGMLTQVLKSRFNEAYERGNLALKIEPAVPADELRRLYEQGHVERVRLVAHQPPSDAFESIGNYVEPEELGAVETHLRPHRGFRFLSAGRTIQEAVEGTDPESTLVFAGADYDELKIDLDLGAGRKKAVTVLPQLGAGTLQYHVDDELEYQDGEPTRDSLREAALRHLRERHGDDDGP